MQAATTIARHGRPAGALACAGAALAVAAGAGCTYSLPADDLSSWTQRFYEASATCADVAPPGQFVHTGHRAGCSERYALNLDGARTDPADPIDIARLMDRAFDELGLTAIEIDVQSSPLDARDVIVVHDPVGGRRHCPIAVAYMEANTLQRVIEHFAEAGHHRAGRHLFIEIKAPYRGAELDVRTADLVDRTAAAVVSLNGHPDAGAVRERLAFLTFNFAALQRLRDALQASGSADGCGYALMATSNRFPTPVFWMVSLPRFDDAIVTRMTETPWLTATVFAPPWISGFAETFNGINSERVRRGMRPLELHLAIYTQRLDGYLRTMQRATANGTEPLQHVAGLVYDLD